MVDMRSTGEPEYTDADFQMVRRIAKQEAGIFIPDSKSTLVYSRVSRRVRESGLATFHAYLNFAQSPSGRAELEKLICAITTNVTSFFRERPHFVHMEKHVLPMLANRLRNGGKGRIWSSACSTGQEPWSIAMSVLSAFPEAASYDMRILATDINSDVVAQAAAGTYVASETDGISSAQKSQFMQPDQQGNLTFYGNIRTLPTFKVLNLNADWPMRGQFSVIFCRNVVIYFDEPTRERLWSRLADKLEKGGFLYVGHSEKVGNPRQCGLEQVAPTIYRKDT
ncbi:CheR family methyltransferase [Gluconobacter japonicus]|uniref:Chemotaxis protein methyltransferase n=1 Tax=Gluconobacter japonicus TaxID=376620 RepID=A0ABQ5WIJ2_GLUJA|nr:protein-glutamate O-methyltransferase [Gluconobacter japonicus]KXV29727.1 chemotaxis protein [Gluconobacter japonicus]GBR26726.1 chemotaxis protein CheR [Gluconobacter japonicus NBRC 3271]GLQ59658.1 chemotaxis protein methyltransferase [Gluconobacter japonicus]